VAYFTAGAASEAGAAVGDAAAVGAGEGVAIGGGGTFLTASGATLSGVVGGATTAAVSTLASQAAVALINNKGDVGGALHDLGSSANVKGLVASIITGGVLGGLNLNATGGPTQSAGASPFLDQLGQNLKAGAAKAVVNSAIYGTSLEDNLKTEIKGALISTVAAQTANAIGDQHFDTFTNKIAHAIAGCVAGAASTAGTSAGKGSGCSAGALGAAVGEISAELYGAKSDTMQFASMVAGISAAVAGQDINLASAAGGNAAANNFLNHTQAALMKKDLGACAAKPAGCSTQETDAIFNQYRKLSSQNIDQVQACKFTGNVQCVADIEANAAKPGEVTGTALSTQQEGWLYARQSDVQSYASVNGNSGPGNTDVQQAQEIARFRQANCADPGSAACDAVVTQAMRSAQTGALKLVGGALLAGPVSALASLTPAAVGAVGVALRACAADPILCASTASIVGADAATMGATGTGALGATLGGAKAIGALEQAAVDATAVSRMTNGVAASGRGFDAANLESKLAGYLLDAEHAQNQTKATWFDQALGFNQSNWQDLASQLYFNPATAVATKSSQFGQTFEQVISIVGANGRTIDTTFVFIRDPSGTVRFVTGIPTKQ
jgi:filamentous hemagglutinin